jgi:4-amino-4-deoxy-L-arabinose transferase-like glycosyltransferase
MQAMSFINNELPITDNRLIASLPVWLRSLWSHVLFPGASDGPSKTRLSAILILLFVPALLLYPTLNFHLFEPDEGRYAEIPREMLLRGELVVPYLQSEPYLDKPPLLYWLVMLSYQLLGVSAWSARLVPAVAVHLCILLTYWIGRRSLGERPAFWGALILSLAPGFISVGRLLVLDGLLTLWTTLSLMAGFEALRSQRLRWAWWLVAAAACGLGVLTKGPIAVILLLPPLIAYGWLSGRCCRVRPDAALIFAGVVLLLILPWYAAICFRLPAFAGDFFWKHNIRRFFTPFDHLEPIWYYVPLLLAGLLPGALLLWPLVRFLLSSAPVAVKQRSAEFGFMLLAGGWCVLFFSLSGCKLPTYVLPAFPFLALALGYFLVARGWNHSPWTRVVVACGLAFLLIAHHFVLPWYAKFKSPYGREAEVAQLCNDASVPVVCYPRSCDSLGFYLGRDDLSTYRSKDTPALVEFLREQPRTVVIFMHRNSLETLRQVLPPQLALTDETPLFDSARAGLQGWKYLLSKSPLSDGGRDSKEGMCYMAVVISQSRRCNLTEYSP